MTEHDVPPSQQPLSDPEARAAMDRFYEKLGETLLRQEAKHSAKRHENDMQAVEDAKDRPGCLSRALGSLAIMAGMMWSGNETPHRFTQGKQNREGAEPDRGGRPR